MSEKIRNTYNMEVNGLVREVKFVKTTVEELFIPFLGNLTKLRAKLDRKIVVYVAAPPATGKSTLTLFLEKISRENPELSPIRALGMDGFHYTNEYLKANKIVIDGEEVPLMSIKGAPETFDVDSLQEKLREVRQEGTDWNIYDRKIHDVVPNAISVEDDIILLEGNYLLLKDPRWTNVRALADYSVFITADANLLKERLISRKVAGGMSREDAEKFYYASDSKNVERVLNDSAPADEVWELKEDDDFEKIFPED